MLAAWLVLTGPLPLSGHSQPVWNIINCLVWNLELNNWMITNSLAYSVSLSLFLFCTFADSLLINMWISFKETTKMYLFHESSYYRFSEEDEVLCYNGLHLGLGRLKLQLRRPSWAPGVKDVQASLTRAISDTDRNLGIKLTVCLHFALAIKHIKRFFCPFLPHINPIAREF